FRLITIIAFIANITIAILANADPIPVLFDLRDHATGGKTATISEIGDTVIMDLYVVLTAANSNPNDESLQSRHGSFLSSKGGLLGNLDVYSAIPPFNANGQQIGANVDLDGDGDLDIGTLNNDQLGSAGFYSFRSASPTRHEPDGGFFIGQI